MKTLVTGGAGFIGSHVAKWLLQNGHHVIIVDDLSGGNLDNIPSEAEFIKGSITDYNLVEDIFSNNNIDYVYHLAAYAAEGLSHFIRRYNYDNNLTGSVNLINQSVLHKVKCFVFTSSIAVYGSLVPPMSEDMQPRPEDPYGIAKYAVEMDLSAAHEQFGLKYIIFRPHNVYGEGQNIGDKYRNVIGIFMNQILQSQPLTVFGSGEQTRAFTYIDDIAPLIANSVNNKSAYNNIFNVGGTQPYSINQLVQAVGEAMGVTPTVTYLNARNEVLHAYSSQDKTERVFGVSESTPLQRGLDKMAQWVKQVGARKTKGFANIEISQSLPDGW